MTLSMTFHTLDTGEYPLALSNDGTAAGYFKKVQSGSNLLVVVDGGGFVFDLNENAYLFPATNSRYTGQNGSTTPYVGTTLDSDDGILSDHASNPFRAWHMAKFVYTSSDLWTGRTTQTQRRGASSARTWRFYGFHMLDAFLDEMIEVVFPTVTNVVMVGISAGAAGVALNLAHIANKLDTAGVSWRVVLDSYGLPPNKEPYYGGDNFITWEGYKMSQTWGNGLAPNVYIQQNGIARVGSPYRQHVMVVMNTLDNTVLSLLDVPGATYNSYTSAVGAKIQTEFDNVKSAFGGYWIVTGHNGNTAAHASHVHTTSDKCEWAISGTSLYSALSTFNSGGTPQLLGDLD